MYKSWYRPGILEQIFHMCTIQQSIVKWLGPIGYNTCFYSWIDRTLCKSEVTRIILLDWCFDSVYIFQFTVSSAFRDLFWKFFFKFTPFVSRTIDILKRPIHDSKVDLPRIWRIVWYWHFQVTASRTLEILNWPFNQLYTIVSNIAPFLQNNGAIKQ